MMISSHFWWYTTNSTQIAFVSNAETKHLLLSFNLDPTALGLGLDSNEIWVPPACGIIRRWNIYGTLEGMAVGNLLTRDCFPRNRPRPIQCHLVANISVSSLHAGDDVFH